MKFYTVGYGNRPPEVFLEILQGAAIRTVIDIRYKPVGRISSYTRTKSADKGIQGLLSSRGIAYLWLGELGNPFKDDDDWRTKYPPVLAAAWESARPKILVADGPACIMCGCLRIEMCHRKYVADLLIQLGHEVLHL